MKKYAAISIKFLEIVKLEFYDGQNICSYNSEISGFLFKKRHFQSENNERTEGMILFILFLIKFEQNITKDI